MSRQRFPYTYPARVIDVHDPVRAGRIKVRVPSVLKEKDSPWANVLLPPTEFSSYREGDLVAVVFREGNPRYPLVLGQYTTYNAKHVAKEFSDWTLETYQDISRDAKDHTVGWDDLDHKKGEGHNHPPYWNPNIGGRFWPLGAKWFVSEEPGDQGMTFLDRLGQLLRFRGDPAGPKDPHDETRIGGWYTADGLDQNSEVRKTGWRAMLEMLGVHGQRFAMRVKDKDQEEEIELRNQNAAGDHFGRLFFSNSLLQMKNLLERIIPNGRSQHYEQVEDPEDPTVDFQRLFDWLGQEIRISTDASTPEQWLQLSTPGGERLKIIQNIQDQDIGVIEVVDRGGNRVALEQTAGGDFVDRIRVKHHLGQVFELDKDGNVLVHNDAADETLKLNAQSGGIEIVSTGGLSINSDGSINIQTQGGVVVSCASPFTINGKPVAVNGDTVTTSVNTTDSAGHVGTGSGSGSVLGTGV